jgi:hypothetical protein
MDGGTVVACIAQTVTIRIGTQLSEGVVSAASDSLDASGPLLSRGGGNNVMSIPL